MGDRNRRRQWRKARKRERRRQKTKRTADRRATGESRGQPEVPARPPVETRHLETITAHVERHIGPVAGVVHELKSELIHVDVLRVAPTARRPYWTLVTSGMSDAPMRDQSCPEHSFLRHAELVLCLPATWPLDLRDPRWGWPYTLLGELARLPHAKDTWLAWGHTWEVGRRRRLAPNVPFSGAVFLPPATLPVAFTTCLEATGRRIDFLGVVLLHRRELKLKLARGLDALLDRVGWDSLSEVVDLKRPCGMRRRAAG